MQTRTGSAVEALANIVVGFTINWTANMLVLPLFGFAVTGAQAFGIGLIFTVISLVRSYVLRRWFNGLRWGNRAVETRPLEIKISDEDRERILAAFRNSPGQFRIKDWERGT